MVEIIPAIMPKSFSDLEEHVNKIKGLVPLVQIDIMDGIFVSGKTWPYVGEGENGVSNVCEKKEVLPYKDVLDYEVDLMVSKSEHVVESWMQLGVSRVIVHIESTECMEDIIAFIKAHTEHTDDEDSKVVSLGIAINTTTSVELINQYAKDIDFVQCMGIAEIGKQGQTFDDRVYEQLRSLRKKYPELTLSVDGAVHFDNAKDLVEAGANRLVSGSGIFGDVNTGVDKKIEQFRDIVNKI